MVRINLLKSASRSKGPVFAVPRGFYIVLIVAALLGGMGSLGMWVYKNIKLAPVPKKHELVAEKKMVPSSHKNVAIVEDVVRDIHDTQLKQYESGYLRLPYDQLSFAERVNYEVLFAKNVCDLFSKAAPSGIGLECLDVADFQTIYVVGLGSTRDVINQFMKALISEGVAILPQPYSTIKPNKESGYKFVLSCKAEFGLKINDPAVDLSLEQLPARADLKNAVDSLSGIIAGSACKNAQPLAQINAEKVGDYRQFTYGFKANASYRDFVRLIGLIYQARVPCALKKFKLAAKSRSNVEITADIVITTRD